MGCLFFQDIRRVGIVVLFEKHPRGVEVFKIFSKNIVDVSGFLNEGQEIRSRILGCGRVCV